MPGARQGRAPLLPIESGNEEMMLPLTLEIQMRAMARTLLRGAGACRQRISPAQRRQGSSARAQRKRHVSEGYGRAVRLWLKPVIGHAMQMAMAVANSRTNCMQFASAQAAEPALARSALAHTHRRRGLPGSRQSRAG